MSHFMFHYGLCQQVLDILGHMLVGYARVSTRDQILDTQLSKLSHCEKVFSETYTGSLSSRPQLQACLEFLREGDVLYITRLDRLARSTLHLCQIGELLQRKGVPLTVIDQNIDTSTSTGRLLFNMLGAIAQFENELRKERQREGIEAAKRRGIQLGSVCLLKDDEVKELKEKRRSGILIKDLMRYYRLSKSSVYRYLRS